MPLTVGRRPLSFFQTLEWYPPFALSDCTYDPDYGHRGVFRSVHMTQITVTEESFEHECIALALLIRLFLSHLPLFHIPNAMTCRSCAAPGSNAGKIIVR